MLLFYNSCVSGNKRDTLVRNAAMQKKNSESIKKIEVDHCKLNKTVEEIQQSISGFLPLSGIETKQVPAWPKTANKNGLKVLSVRGLRLQRLPK